MKLLELTKFIINKVNELFCVLCVFSHFIFRYAVTLPISKALLRFSNKMQNYIRAKQFQNVGNLNKLAGNI